jgi:hypothetical protein
MRIKNTALKMKDTTLTMRDAAIRTGAFVLLVLTLQAAPGAGVSSRALASADAAAEVRGAMERAFERLRGGDYGGVYDALPSASQRRITRARFVSALERAQGLFELERLEIDRVRVAGDLAVVDTVVYAQLRRPVEGEGKVVSRQYMVREGGEWRVTTGDRSTVRPLLAANPAFARQFPPTEPRIYFKRDGRWLSLDTLNGSRRRRG